MSLAAACTLDSYVGKRDGLLSVSGAPVDDDPRTTNDGPDRQRGRGHALRSALVQSALARLTISTGPRHAPIWNQSFIRDSSQLPPLTGKAGRSRYPTDTMPAWALPPLRLI